MMSNEKYHLHPISAVINFLKSLKDMLIPILIVFVGNGFHFSISLDPRDELFWENVPTLILLIVLFFVLIAGIIKWWKFIYWFEDNELRVEYGLFVKKKRYIPFDRIQSLNYKEGIFHRILGLVQVKVETAANKDGKPEAELTAVTKIAAEQIEEEMRKAKNKIILVDDETVNSQQLSEITKLKPTVEVIHKMSMKNILILATTSGAIGVVLSGAAAVLSQFSEFIPYEKIFNELADFVKIGALLVGMAIFSLFILAWVISVFITAINYYDFTVSRENDKLIITRGLLEKKRVTIPLNRVQAIRVVENPFRQLFGFATIVLESAGGGSGEANRKITLFPLVKKGEEIAPLNELFPEYDFPTDFTSAPKRAHPFFYRVDFIWAIPIVVACSYFFYPYGLLSIILIPLVVALGLWQHRTTGFTLKGKQLTMRFRSISRVTIYMHKHRIQALVSKQSYFQNKKQLATVQATVMSGLAGATARVHSIREQDAATILKWYEHEKTSD